MIINAQEGVSPDMQFRWALCHSSRLWTIHLCRTYHKKTSNGAFSSHIRRTILDIDHRLHCSNVEAAISALPSTPEIKPPAPGEPHSGSASPSGSTTPSRAPGSIPPPLTLPNTPGSAVLTVSSPSPHLGEEAAMPLALPSPGIALAEDARKLLREAGGTISKPLSAIGRIFSEVVDGVTTPGPPGAESRSKLGSYLPGPFAPLELGREAHATQTPVGGAPGEGVQYQTPYKPRVRRGPSSVSPAASPGPLPEDTPTRPGPAGPYTNQPLALGPSQAYFPAGAGYQQQPLPARVQSLAQSELLSAGDGQGGVGVSRTPTPNLDFAGMQHEIDRAHEQASAAAKSTLMQIFPGTDNEVIDWVLEANDGDLGKSIEALLEMS
jgi:Rab5 GDP/GTP exchange factor